MKSGVCLPTPDILTFLFLVRVTSACFQKILDNRRDFEASELGLLGELGPVGFGDRDALRQIAGRG